SRNGAAELKGPSGTATLTRRATVVARSFGTWRVGLDEHKATWLARHPLLVRCPGRVIRRVASVADEVRVAAGEALAEQGRPAEWFFLIHSGEAEVARDGIRLGVLGPGDWFGEVALLGRGMQPVALRALTP